MDVKEESMRDLAQRIARRMEDPPVEQPAGDLAAMAASLRRIENRLAHLESHLGHDERAHAATGGDASVATRSPWLRRGVQPSEHPSAEKFAVGETVSELVDYFEREKTCALEPGGKPCDHCAMCSSRGF